MADDLGRGVDAAHCWRDYAVKADFMMADATDCWCGRGGDARDDGDMYFVDCSESLDNEVVPACDALDWCFHAALEAGSQLGKLRSSYSNGIYLEYYFASGISGGEAAFWKRVVGVAVRLVKLRACT